MVCTGYNADTGRKYYVDYSSGGTTYVGAPYAEYGVLTPLKSETTAAQDNAHYGRRLFDVDGTNPIPKRRANTVPVRPTWDPTDCARIIPRRPQNKEEELHPRYQDGSDGPNSKSKVLNHSKTHRAKSVETWLPRGWGPYISATAEGNQDPAKDEEGADAADSGSTTESPEHKDATDTSPRLGEYTFDQESLTFIPSNSAEPTSESPRDSISVRHSSPVQVDADQTADSESVIEPVVEPAASVTPLAEVGSVGKKRRRTIFRKLFQRG
ncbi:hypothetical protein M413DRAFT_420462 [Hebeloma cylindrosporum]|uniref:Uncharacterized protein n=1 Tax=Hebeloma cylindrosporum TaxID=76867 RepID=A0A0C2YBD9_HEBCY|nr:hypothetical protein M413DRAFT_420462 [Hebeloma cylindrosporum h7]